MPKYYVEYHRMKERQHIVEQDTLRQYAGTLWHDPKSVDAQRNRTNDVISSCPRVEYYVKDSEGKTVACFILMRTLDMHHGETALFCADWIHPAHRRKREIHELRKWYLKRFCTTFGLKKYQRSKHLSPTVQIQITKEV